MAAKERLVAYLDIHVRVLIDDGQVMRVLTDDDYGDYEVIDITTRDRKDRPEESLHWNSDEWNRVLERLDREGRFTVEYGPKETPA